MTNPTPHKPRNRRMDILRAIAIVLVVIGHTGALPSATWYSTFFPMGSYRLAIFLFISGYFFRDLTWQAYPAFVWKKTKSLLIPFLGWNIVYAGIISILRWRDIVDYLPSLREIWSFYCLLLEPFYSGHQYILNLAAWFVGMLYPALLLYGVVNILWHSRMSDHVMLAIYAVLAMAGLYCAPQAQLYHELLLPLHLSYALFFIHLGKYYRTYIEPYLEQVSSWIIIPAGMLFQYLTVRIGGEVMYSLSFMHFDGRFVMPLLMAIAGILVWVRIARIIEVYVMPNRLEKAVSESTWDIMTHHILVKFLIGWGLIQWAIEPEMANAFRESIWFVPTKIDYWGLVLLEVALPVGWHYLFGWIKRTLHMDF